MKHITVVTPCYNEEENVEEIHRQAREVLETIEGVTYEHLFIDNFSSDRTPELLRAMASADPKVKVIFNARNFGHIRSPYHGLLQARGDAAILLVADLQDPPELMKAFIEHWRNGAKLVVGVKPTADESGLMFAIRRAYYRTVTRIADVKLIQNFTGFGLYDRKVLEELRRIDDPYPYLRGLVSEVGFEAVQVPYNQPRRKRGITKNNFYTLYDIAMLGITSHSRVPLRIATMVGFALSGLSLVVSLLYLFLKIFFWSEFSAGTAPILIGMFFFASVQLFFIGLLGEYVGAILTHVMKRPLVVERERLNFDNSPAD
ncbi:MULTISPECIES: glycosyltransferase family 2 protein [Variovorax]|jgi:polyisoprenyl-phosphate glycosyltransferase|uniref:glycosyltransferase family 2 protein n=1 Tax=Variovorax TaxID=34072 RepID=UPI00086DABEC|nr:MULTISPECIES: glycosyltransferase family 2 protein [Variovorax]MBN8757975.1 glycosyltransferase family 2 protein [Variovorax sp.]ODU13407.1 MAG: dolichol monophosphate mannose synthase [Variovorax sp. SCN 67-85]ODV23072.1 MAG: dolichol monophosphate mannose synthase [Variovorax sp. SCN 67-20]OJZ12915.1 MAG: glycosyltransferase [Variovorax sp. 67-131]UKI09500.1 glycosyltransferase family 2 protein [Variovorax paradoxus]